MKKIIATLICFVVVMVTCGFVFAYQRQIIIPIGSKTITVDGQKKNVDTPAIIINGRTMIGLRTIADIFGAYTAYDEKKKEVSIYLQNNEPKTKLLLSDDRRPSKNEGSDDTLANTSSNTYVLQTNKKFCRVLLEVGFSNRNGFIEYSISDSSGTNKTKKIAPTEKDVDLNKKIFTSSIVHEPRNSQILIGTLYRNIEILYIKVEESDFSNFPKE